MHKYSPIGILSIYILYYIFVFYIFWWCYKCMIAAGHCVRAMNGKSIPSPFLWGKGKRQINSLATSENNMLDWLKFPHKCLTSRRQENVEVAEMYSVGGVKVAQTRFSSYLQGTPQCTWWMMSAFSTKLVGPKGSTTSRWNCNPVCFSFSNHFKQLSYKIQVGGQVQCSSEVWQVLVLLVRNTHCERAKVTVL